MIGGSNPSALANPERIIMSCGDAPILKINGRSIERLKIALTLGLSDHKAIGYLIDTKDNNPRMVFFWSEHPKMTPFPGKTTPEFLASFIDMWLQNAEYGNEPDHDGHNDRGWYMYTESWGQINDYDWKSFLAIEPHWIMYGK